MHYADYLKIRSEFIAALTHEYDKKIVFQLIDALEANLYNSKTKIKENKNAKPLQITAKK